MAIASVNLKIYSDASAQTLVATYPGTTATTQTISATGLSATTQYYAVVEATDSNGLVGRSAVQSFTTAAATYTFSGTGVTYSTRGYQYLTVNISVTGTGSPTFTECGIEFSTNSSFTGTLITGSNTTPPANDFVDQVSGFAEHTTYYYRYFAVSTQYGRQTYVPSGNTITTHYAEPQVTISVSNITDTDAQYTLTYTGNYPVTNLQLTITPDGGSYDYIQVQNMSGTQTGSIASDWGHILVPNTEYYLEATAEYYGDEALGNCTFRTLPARPSVAISSVSNITPTSADINISIS